MCSYEIVSDENRKEQLFIFEVTQTSLLLLLFELIYSVNINISLLSDCSEKLDFPNSFTN